MTASANALRFSLVEGGPLYRIGQRLGLAPGSRSLVQLGMILAAVTWVPLFVLNLLGGPTTDGATLSFGWSLGTHVRFLVAIPLFFAAEAAFDAQARSALGHLLDSGLVTSEQRPRFDAALRSAMRWRDLGLIEAALVAVAIGLILSGTVRIDLPAHMSSWRGGAGGRFTPAGWWYTMLSLPVFQFLVWRWCWRLLIWWIVLWRLARLDLQLIPTHPDRAGGLGGLGVAHTDLALLSTALSAMLVASYAEDILFGGTTLENHVMPLTAIVVGLTALVLLPLVFFSPRLVAVKQRGLLDYGVLAASYTRAFDRKWLRGGAPAEEVLGTADLQSLADLGNSFEVIRDMRPVPFALYQIGLLVGAAVLPILPLLLTVFPLHELVLRSVKSLVGL